MKVIPTDIYDKDGNLVRIDYHDLEGGFQFEAVWDERDEQTSENRVLFRNWANTMAKRLKFKVKS
jgi:hypothetical protein